MKIINKIPSFFLALRILAKIGVGFFIFTFIWFQVSNTFDTDFGWHTRFAWDALQNNFQFKDSYTWSYYGRSFINLAWGGDIAIGLVTFYLGQRAVVLILSATFFIGFIFILRLKEKKLSLAGLLVILFSVIAVRHLIVVRLALITPLFFAIIIYSLEYFKESKISWFWPAIFWVWAALHGSWVLGLVIILIYLAGNFTSSLLGDKFDFISKTNWVKRDYLKVIILSLGSFFATSISPYGFKPVMEISKLFTENYYRSYIVEFMPSYAYPVYWSSLLLATIILAFSFILFKHKKINFTQLLLICSLYFLGLSQKRNIILVILLGVPILSGVLNYSFKELLEKNIFRISLEKYFLIFFAILSLGGVLYIFPSIDFGDNVWENEKIINRARIPYQAIKFFNYYPGRGEENIFTEFNWTGYIEWVTPQNKVYMDGRSPIAWRNPDNENETMLESYMNILNKEEGLSYLESHQVKFVVLSNDYSKMFRKSGFGEKVLLGEIPRTSRAAETRLKTNLDNSSNWKVIYNDDTAVIWERK